MAPLGRMTPGAQARRLRKLASASRRYLPMPAGPTPLPGPLEVVHRLLSAFAAHDAAALASLFAEDADYVNEVGLWWTSRRSIQRAFKRSFKDEFRAASLSVDKVGFRQVGSDAGVLHARWSLQGQVGPDDLPGDLRRGLFTFVLERVQDGSWLIVSGQATDIVPAADTFVAEGGTVKAASYLPGPAEEPSEARAEADEPAR